MSGALLQVLNVVVPAATDSSESGELWLLVAGPLVGIALYFGFYRYYRNTDKSHNFERETTIDAEPITGSDEKVDEVHGTQSTMIQGENARRYRDRVQRIE